MLNEQPVTCDTIIRNSDVLGHRMHRHEPPVTDEPITIVEKTDDLWVVNKPASIPVSYCINILTISSIISNK